MELLPVLFASGLSAALVAWWKGNSVVVWFLIGLCLPVMGTIVAYLYRSELKEPRRRCEDCGRILAITDQVCFGCGRDLGYPEHPIVPSASR